MHAHMHCRPETKLKVRSPPKKRPVPAKFFFFWRTFDLDFAMATVCACTKGCGLNVSATGAAQRLILATSYIFVMLTGSYTKAQLTKKWF